MAGDDDELKIKKRLEWPDLSGWSVMELQAYLKELKAEMERADAEIERKDKIRKQAEALFKPS